MAAGATGNQDQWSNSRTGTVVSFVVLLNLMDAGDVPAGAFRADWTWPVASPDFIDPPNYEAIL